MGGYRAVVFDLFGTLVPDVQAGVHQRMADRLGLSLEVFRLHWDKDYAARSRGERTFLDSLRDLARACLLTVDQGLVEDLATIRTVDVERCLAMVNPDVIPALRALREARLARGLLSNASLEVPDLWRGSPLAPWFDMAVFSCEAGLCKPDPEAYRLVCGKLGVSPAECLFVGDGADQELAGAAAVGMTPVQVASRRVVQSAARSVIQSIAEVLPIIGLPGLAAQIDQPRVPVEE